MYNQIIANIFYWFGQAAVPLGRGGAKLARAFLNHTIFWDPGQNRARGWLYLIDGVEARDRGDLPGSVKHLRNAVAVLPDNAAVIANLGISLALDGQYDTATQIIERALRSETDVTGEPQIWVALMWSYLRSGRAPKALEAAERAEASHVFTHEVRILRLLSMAACRGFVNRAELRELLAIRVRMLPMVLEFIEQLARNGSRDLARQIVDCVPGRVRERTLLVTARSCFNHNDLDTALWATRQYEAQTKDAGPAACLRAEILLRRNDLPGALSTLIKAHQTLPRDGAVAAQLVRVRLLRGEVQPALIPAQTAFAQHPSAEAGAVIALTALEQDNLKAARKVFSKQLIGDVVGVVIGSAVQAQVHAISNEPEAALRLIATAVEEINTLPTWARTNAFYKLTFDILETDLEKLSSETNTPTFSEAMDVQRKLIKNTRERIGIK